jgi:hypothetical protein
VYLESGWDRDQIETVCVFTNQEFGFEGILPFSSDNGHIRPRSWHSFCKSNMGSLAAYYPIDLASKDWRHCEIAYYENYDQFHSERRRRSSIDNNCTHDIYLFIEWLTDSSRGVNMK